MDKVGISSALHKLKVNVRAVETYMTSVCLEELDFDDGFFGELVNRIEVNTKKLKENV